MLAAENGVLGDETLDAEAREVAEAEWEWIRNGHAAVSAAHQEFERVNSDTDPNETVLSVLNLTQTVANS